MLEKLFPLLYLDFKINFKSEFDKKKKKAIKLFIYSRTTCNMITTVKKYARNESQRGQISREHPNRNTTPLGGEISREHFP